MKKIIITKIMRYIANNTNYTNVRLKEIEYGLVSLYLTLTKTVVIILFAIFLGIIKEVLIFMILFNILRTTGFGLHATKSWVCLLSSLIIFLIIPSICKFVYLSNYIKLIICVLGVIFIYKNAPADTKKKPIVNKKLRFKLKIICTISAIMFTISAITIKNDFLSNCLVFALLLENVLIAPFTYKIFKLPYNNYVTYLREHPELIN